MNVIEIKDLKFSYPGAKAPVLKGVDLEIEKGDFVAIIGNNGCGKSTLCKVMNGLIPHFITGDFEGSVQAAGVETRESDIGTLARKVGYVYQDFENQIVRPTVLDDASYACMNYAMKDYRERGIEALEKCGLSGREQDYIWQLSGGQTHLLALAGALSLSPEVLILDEPIAQLDPHHADTIYEILKELNEQHGKTIIVIEHHTEYIGNYCRHAVLMKDGKIKWKLPVGEALQRVEELEESDIFPPQVTRAAYRLRTEGRLAEGGKLPSTVEEGRKTFADFIYTGRKENCGEPSPAGEKEETVSCENVSVSYRSVKGEPKQIFSGLDLKLYKGEKIALIGSNGAGKSTLMKLMVGLLKPSDGKVMLKGQSVGDTRPEKLSRYVSLVYQNPEDMFIKGSIEADIAYAMKVRNEEGWQERTEELLRRFRLTELKDRDGRLLSGGQMRRASLAIGVALQPEILLLDEPTANLDIATRKEIMRTLRDMKEITDTVMIATHDMQLVCEWAERIIVLCGGRVVADGPRDAIFRDGELLRTVGIRPPEIFAMGRALDPASACYTIDDFLARFTGRAGQTREAAV